MAQSESIKAIVPALIRARQAFKPLEKTRENPFFKSKYASLDDVLSATDEALTENGLAVIQATEGSALRTVLAHSSGEWIDGIYPLAPSKQNDPQALGAAVTYARRYALQGILGICAEEDDDGNRASGKGVSRPSAPPQSRPVSQNDSDFDFPPSESPAPHREPGDDDDDTTQVKNIEEKSGTSKSGKPYTMFKIEFVDGRKCSTFDKNFAAEAKIARDRNLRVAVTLEKGDNFEKFKSFELKHLGLVAGAY